MPISAHIGADFSRYTATCSKCDWSVTHPTRLGAELALHQHTETTHRFEITS